MVKLKNILAPKESVTRAGYNEMPTIPDIDIAETMGAMNRALKWKQMPSRSSNTVEERREDEEEGEPKKKKRKKMNLISATAIVGAEVEL